MIEGVAYFDRAKDLSNRAALERERAELEKAEANKPGVGASATTPPIPRDRGKADLDDAEGDHR
jgi:hypothetical protein